MFHALHNFSWTSFFTRQQLTYHLLVHRNSVDVHKSIDVKQPRIKRPNNQVVNNQITVSATALPTPCQHNKHNINSAAFAIDYFTSYKINDLTLKNGKMQTLHIYNVWLLIQKDRCLQKDRLRLSLTPIELMLVTKMYNHVERVISKEDLIKTIGRDPENYTGLEMCLSRLQKKFKQLNNGECLFRSVRNRGYCLVQIIKLQ